MGGDAQVGKWVCPDATQAPTPLVNCDKNFQFWGRRLHTPMPRNTTAVSRRKGSLSVPADMSQKPSSTAADDAERCNLRYSQQSVRALMGRPLLQTPEQDSVGN